MKNPLNLGVSNGSGKYSIMYRYGATPMPIAGGMGGVDNDSGRATEIDEGGTR